MNIKEFYKLNNLVTTAFRRKHIIVINPEDKEDKKEKLDTNVIYDKAEWKIPKKIQDYVQKITEDGELSNEQKILLVYERLCKEYIYDDNLLSYIQKIDDDSYSLPDWYGRDVDETWEQNRNEHNRRVCYEVSRYLAKSLQDMFKDNKDFNICILWDKGLTHYFVGLTCNDYSITLDLDDFNNIKDLTRIKAGLTAEGIRVLRDEKGKFTNALETFNQGRNENAIMKIKKEAILEGEKESDNLAFLKNVIEILTNEYGIDSQGIYEYVKEIVDITLGPEARKKVWKEIKTVNNEDTRYIRCLVIDIDGQKYIIDVEEKMIRQFTEEELNGENRDFIPYKELLSEELVNYRSRKEQRYNGR